MGANFFIDIGISVILAVLRTRHIPAGYVKAFVKLRDALNLAFPVELEGQPAKEFTVVK